MSAPTPKLGAAENKVFTTVRQRIAMPLLEVAAATKINVEELQVTIDKLAEQNLITINDRNDPLSAIVSVNKRFL
jgi:hypothetical protein